MTRWVDWVDGSNRLSGSGLTIGMDRLVGLDRLSDSSRPYALAS